MRSSRGREPLWDHQPCHRAQLVGGVLGALASLVVRFARARGLERQQLKWFVYAAGLGVAVLVLPTPIPDFQEWTLAPVGLSVAAAVAVLRYRLYDIDRIINRTLVYGVLTAVLGLGDAGVVLVFGQLFGGVGERTPSWVVAGATWPWPPCSNRPAIASKPRLTDASTGASTMPPRLSSVLHAPARPGRPRHAVQRPAGGRCPDHGADPGLAVASTLPTRLLEHTPQQGTANYLGLLSSSSAPQAAANQAAQWQRSVLPKARSSDRAATS
jgi:hypothetical protein